MPLDGNHSDKVVVTLAGGEADRRAVWPAPFDFDAACWHVALTLAAVYGLQPDEPVLWR